jgi:hypothetical protein
VGALSAGSQMVKAVALYAKDVGVQVPPGGLAGVAQWLESDTSNVVVVGSSPIARSKISLNRFIATIAQLVEHPICNRAVVGSNPTRGSFASIAQW